VDDHFKPISEFPGYRVSQYGVVQSCWTRHARPTRMTGTWLTLKPINRGHGYLSVNLSKDGKKKARSIHRLVLEAFVGPCPPGMICCHGDGDPKNNRHENLRWDSPKSNSDDAFRHGTLCRGESARQAKLLEADVLEIRTLRSEGVKLGVLAEHFGVGVENIRAIVCHRSWRHLP
jgi:hypothetical protein